jgi:hypothetical protein
MFQQNRVFAPEKGVTGEGIGTSSTHDNESGSLESVSEEGHHLVLEYKIGGPLTYVTASAHCKRFLDLAVDRVLINLSHVTRIDHDGMAALEVGDIRTHHAFQCSARHFTVVHMFLCMFEMYSHLALAGPKTIAAWSCYQNQIHMCLKLYTLTRSRSYSS